MINNLTNEKCFLFTYYVPRVLNRFNLKASLFAEQTDVNSGFIQILVEQALKPTPNTELLQVMNLPYTFNYYHIEHIWMLYFALLKCHLF